MESNSTQIFLKWFRFRLYMKPERKPPGLAERESLEFWKHNVQCVEVVLHKYS